MKIPQKNIFISSSCIVPKCEFTFTREERLFQLLNTIESCNKISDRVNIISEGSLITQEEKKVLEKVSTVFTYENDFLVEELTKIKQLGAVILWARALQRIEVDDDANIFFLSGRYFLTNDFDIDIFKGDYVFKKHWYSPERGGWYGTQLYKIAGKNKNGFLSILEDCMQRIGFGQAHDVECSLYQSLQSRGITPTEVENVFCAGFLGINRQLETH
jgi:hypothetical protein